MTGRKCHNNHVLIGATPVTQRCLSLAGSLSWRAIVTGLRASTCWCLCAFACTHDTQSRTPLESKSCLPYLLYSLIENQFPAVMAVLKWCIYCMCVCLYSMSKRVFLCVRGRVHSSVCVSVAYQSECCLKSNQSAGDYCVLTLFLLCRSSPDVFIIEHDCRAILN